MKRNKAAILASGLDPDLKGLYQAYGYRDRAKKRLEKAMEAYTTSLEHVERYWEAVEAANEEDGAA
jgi:hypothetical protein